MTMLQVSKKEFFAKRNNRLLASLNIKKKAKPIVNIINLGNKELVLTKRGWIVKNTIQTLQEKFNNL